MGQADKIEEVTVGHREEQKESGTAKQVTGRSRGLEEQKELGTGGDRQLERSR
jgi:hypothetical protein